MRDFLSEIWSEVDKLRPPSVNGFTTQEYADHEGIPRQTARDRLEAMVRAGKLSYTVFVFPGRRTTKYFTVVKPCVKRKSRHLK